MPLALNIPFNIEKNIMFYSVFDSMPTLTNATDQAKVDAVKTNFGTAFTLAAIIGIVLGAVWIMRALNLF
jgi:hypothetical protein